MERKESAPSRQTFSCLDQYDHYCKSRGEKVRDFLARPLSVTLGGRRINLINKDSIPTAPTCSERLCYGLIATVLAPLTLLIGAPALTSRQCQAHDNIDALLAAKDQPKLSENHITEALQHVPRFDAYSVGENTSLTSLSVRPMNLFYSALFKKDDATTLPGGELFKFKDGLEAVGKYLLSLPDHEVISVCATNKKTDVYRRGWYQPELSEQGVLLSTFFGHNTFRISMKEIRDMLQAQRIRLSPLLPEAFYRPFKRALNQDKVVELPGNEEDIVTMQDLLDGRHLLPHVRSFMETVARHPEEYGFRADSPMSYEAFMNLTLYQVGSMVVKIDSYQSLLDSSFKIRERQVGDLTAINVVSLCGIRGFHTSNQVEGNAKHELDRIIMKHTFLTALQAAGAGVLICPAVGMGVWRGDPDIYWRAFLEAIIEGPDALAAIVINPGHQVTLSGKYRGCGGEEFEYLLNEYRSSHPDNQGLRKIVNVFHLGTDLFKGAQHLRTVIPEGRITLLNASDPDVTLGNHVGEYVNNLCHASTTEENYAAAGLLTLCYEQLTRVLQEQGRVIPGIIHAPRVENADSKASSARRGALRARGHAAADGGP